MPKRVHEAAPPRFQHIVLRHPAQAQCVCFLADPQTCWELQEYGYSPVLYDPEGHSEGSWLAVGGGLDQPKECECPCNAELWEEEDDEWDW